MMTFNLLSDGEGSQVLVLLGALSNSQCFQKSLFCCVFLKNCLPHLYVYVDMVLLQQFTGFHAKTLH